MDGTIAFSNLPLLVMSDDDRHLLLPNLTDIHLGLRHQLECIHQPVEYVYFIQSGMASMVARAPGGREAEIGVVGREGLSGASCLLGDDMSPFDVFMQIEGHALRLPVDALKCAAAASETLMSLMLRFARALAIQTSFTALVNGQANVGARLARWLLMVHDRIDGDTINLTHEFMAVMLGVRRPGVTIALHELEGEGLIRSLRGAVIIRDREGLIERAAGVYGLPEREYSRLIGAELQRPS